MTTPVEERQVEAGAVFGGMSQAGEPLYRYCLTRVWGDGDKLGFVMLNPSTADARLDDPTIRRCMGFARLWHFDGIRVVNLFGYRATDPKDLKAAHKQGVDIVGPDNDHWIDTIVSGCPIVIAAWGCQGGLLRRDMAVTRLLQAASSQILCLTRTKAGCPQHPLYARYDVRAVDYP